MDERAYFNDMLVKFEEIFFHELSECAQPKVELIGTDFLKSKNIEGDTIEKVVDGCVREIKAAGLCQDISYSIHGFGILLKLAIKGCIHLPKESKLKQDGVEPYLCPVANMILDQIIEVLNYIGVYMAEMHTDENKGGCIVKCAIYENVDKIGQVSDWTKI
jgi:hypothetical protein